MKFFRRLALALLLLTLCSVAIGTKHAIALWGQGDNVGYFHGVYDSDKKGTYVLPGGTFANPSIPLSVNSNSSFISFIENDYYHGDAQQQSGAAFIIQTMLGGTEHNYPTAAEVTDWEDRINNFAGTVQWDASFSYNYNTYDTEQSPVDDAAYPANDTEIETIVFTNPDGSIAYAVKHRCANPVGNYPGLPDTQKWTLTGSTTVLTPQTAGKRVTGTGNVVYPGDTVYFHHDVSDTTGSDTATGIAYQVNQNYSTPKTSFTVAGSSGTANILVGQPLATQGTIVIPQVGAGTKYCQTISYSDATGPSTAGATTTTVCVVVAFHVPICSGATTSPSIVQAGVAFTISETIKYRDYTPKTVALTLNSTPPISQSTTASPGPSLTQTTATLNVLSPPGLPAGSYTLTATLDDASGHVLYTCPPASISVVLLPYFKVFGSSVAAGGGFSSTDPACTGNGTLAGWNDNSGTNPNSNRGSGADYAALATSDIVGFASSQKDDTPSSPAAAGYFLSIADAGSGVPVGPTDPFSPKLGGYYGGSLCQTSETEATSLSPLSAGLTAPTDLSGLNSGQYSVPGSINLASTSGIGNGKQITLFVNGDVYISSNIEYNGADGWTQASDIPSLIIQATGNIFIDPSVTNLDGLYIAKPNTATNPVSGGNIYTCGTIDATGDALGTIDPTELATVCNKQLVVHGSFVAQQVDLLRTFGTLNNAAAGESPSGTVNNSCTNEGASPSGSSCAAEEFDFSPEFYLSTPSIGSSGGSGTETYDSVTSLPPIL